MKKTCSILAIIALAILTLTGCSGGKLAAEFDEAQVKTAVETAIRAVDSGDYDGFSTLVADEVKAALSPEIMKSAIEKIRPAPGEFNRFISESTKGQKDQSGNDCAVVTAIAEYKNQMVTYTVSLNKDLKIIGFYVA